MTGFEFFQVTSDGLIKRRKQFDISQVEKNTPDCFAACRLSI
jgi:hypothetical protein